MSPVATKTAIDCIQDVQQMTGVMLSQEVVTVRFPRKENFSK
jgi:hypothetical protein